MTARATLLAVIALLVAAGAHAELLAQLGKQNPGLPDECLTYAERYDEPAIERKLRDLDLGQGLSAVVLLKLHGVHGGMRADQALAFKALAAEVQESGYEFVILHQQVHEAPITRRKALQLVPPALHQYLVFHDFRADLADYPRLRQATAEVARRNLDALGPDAELGSGPGPPLPYLGTMEFMLRYAAYEWLWEIEYDCRLVGHWGRFLNSALAIAQADSGLDWGPQVGSNEPSRTAKLAQHSPSMEAYPARSHSSPDLLFFGPSWHRDKWRDSQVNMNRTLVHDGFVMVWGASRRFFDAMEQMTAQDKGGFIEMFLLAVAEEHNLKAVPVELPRVNTQIYDWLTPGAPVIDSWHYEAPTSVELYQRWARSEECMHTVLLHPIKAGWDPRIEEGLTHLP